MTSETGGSRERGSVRRDFLLAGGAVGATLVATVTGMPLIAQRINRAQLERHDELHAYLSAKRARLESESADVRASLKQYSTNVRWNPVALAEARKRQRLCEILITEFNREIAGPGNRDIKMPDGSILPKLQPLLSLDDEDVVQFREGPPDGAPLQWDVKRPAEGADVQRIPQ